MLTIRERGSGHSGGGGEDALFTLSLIKHKKICPDFHWFCVNQRMCGNL